MLQVKEAVKRSLENFGELFPGESKQGLRLEEVLLDDSQKHWKVTISFKNPEFESEIAALKRSSLDGVEGMFGPDDKNVPVRYYKTIAIRADDGQLVGIRNEWDLM